VKPRHNGRATRCGHGCATRCALTLAQVATFLDSVESDRLAALYKVAIGLGLRQGELLALRWSDVNLDAGTLKVRNTRNLITGELAEPKTDSSRRTLRLGAELTAALRSHKARQSEERLAAGRKWHDEDYVFTSPTGHALDSANVRHSFQAALARAELPHQRFHDMRHACATLRLEQGEELAIVSKILGHASLSTTADIYGHLTDAMLERAAARTDAIIGRASTA